MKIDRRRIKETIIGIAAVVLVYAGMMFVGVTCPIKHLTGVSCAGCGMTRAWLAIVLHQDIKMALSYHPLFWLVIPVILLLVFKRKVNHKLYSVIIGVVITVAIVVYICRMLSPADQIVVFEPEQGAIYKTLRIIYRLLKGVS